MKFRTQLTLFPLCVLFITGVVVYYVIATWTDMRSLFQRTEQVTEIFEVVDEMKHILSEYERDNDPINLRRLDTQQQSLQLRLAEFDSFPPSQQTLINSIKMMTRSMAGKVLYVMEKNNPGIDREEKAKELMLEKLTINMEVIRENSYQLNSYVSAELRAKSATQLLIVTVALILTSVIFLLLSMSVSKRLQYYLKAMHQGLVNVGKGELKSPIHVDEAKFNDEFGAFIKQFNSISQQLQETTYSRDELQQLIDEKTEPLKKLANTDPLTKVNNRRKLLVDGNNEIERACRYSHALSLLIIDADNFKEINDEHGHQTGDRVLINLCRIIEEEIRSSDIIGRYGGEEFVILLPETNHASARDMAERIRFRVSDQPFLHGRGHIHVTISVGVSTLIDETDVIALIDRADQALYSAKGLGKNTIQSSE